MNKISRLAVLATALASLFAVLSSTAGATTFTNNGGTAFHGTGVGITYGITNGAGGVNNLTCTGATATGSAGMGAITSIVGTITYAPCTLIGLETEIACNYTLTPLVTFVGGVSASLALACTSRLATSPFTPLCTITGSTPVHYVNPVAPSTPARLTFTSSNTLGITNATDASCSSAGVGTGTTRVIDLAHQTITLTSFAESPLIVDP